MRVIHVKSSQWTNISLSTVHSSPTVIQFETYGTLDGIRDVPAGAHYEHQLKDDYEVQSPKSVVGNGGRYHPSKGIKQTLDTSYSSLSAVATREGVNRRLYAFITVDNRGSRILTVTESRQVIERLKAGQVIWNFKRMNGLHEETKTGGNYQRSKVEVKHSPRPQRIFGIEQDNVRLIEKTEQGKSKTEYEMCGVKKNEKFAQIPWLGLSFRLVLPKITLAWITQSDVILALHLSSIRLSCFVAPTRLVQLIGGAEALERILISGSSSQGDSQQIPSTMNWWGRNVGMSNDKTINYRKRLSSLKWDTANIEIGIPDKTRVILQGATKEEQREADHEWQLKEWKFQRKIQQQRYFDLKTEIFTNSEARMNFTIESIHCDHFVEGDIPVILKSISTSSSGESVIPFFYVHIIKRIVDPSFAPIYDDIEVRVFNHYTMSYELCISIDNCKSPSCQR